MDEGTKEIEDYLNKWWSELSIEQKRLIWRNVPIKLLVKEG